MADTKEKFSNLIKNQNLNIFDDPFVVKNFLENDKIYIFHIIFLVKYLFVSSRYVNKYLC